MICLSNCQEGRLFFFIVPMMEKIGILWQSGNKRAEKLSRMFSTITFWRSNTVEFSDIKNKSGLTEDFWKGE
jgi:hypothetical protein